MTPEAAYSLLHNCSEKCGWKPDIEILVVSGFMTQTDPTLDVEKFTDATANWINNSGLPAEKVVKTLCTLAVDGSDDSEFPAYLEQVSASFLTAPEEQKKPEPRLLSTVLPPEHSKGILAALKPTTRDEKQPLGYELATWTWRPDKAEELWVRVSVINATPRPVLDFYVLKNQRLVASHPPVDWDGLLAKQGLLRTGFANISVEVKVA